MRRSHSSAICLRIRANSIGSSFSVMSVSPHPQPLSPKIRIELDPLRIAFSSEFSGRGERENWLFCVVGLLFESRLSLLDCLTSDERQWVFNRLSFNRLSFNRTSFNRLSYHQASRRLLRLEYHECL